MNTNLIVIDNFYEDPDTVRAHILNRGLTRIGNYPGLRSDPYILDGVKESIEYNMQFAGKITGWNDILQYTGSFQITTATDKSWIHSDGGSMWAGVCYMTPGAPLAGGTALYKHIGTGEYMHTTSDHESHDTTKWELVDRIGNKYNRLIIYRGDLFHSSIDYFGSNATDGRLFQTFFFNTERF